VVVALPDTAAELDVWVDVLSYVGIGTAYTAPSVTPVNEIVTLETSGTPTAGDFTLFLAETETAALAYNVSAASTKTALVNTGKAVSGDITAGGGSLPTAITLTWTGVWAGLGRIPIRLGRVSITGGGLNLRVSTAGGRPYTYVPADATLVTKLGPLPTGVSRFLYVSTVASTGNYRASVYKAV
jgi:hypothetical protein